MLQLPRATPESQGDNPAAIEAFLRAADEQSAGLHSAMVLRHGTVVAEGWWEPYRADLRHTMFSVSKSFASTAVGLAVAEGLLSIDEPVLSIFPTYASAAARANAGSMTLRHLLSMSTGHEVDTMVLMRGLPESDWIEVFLSTPVVYPPGTHFLYNSGASYLLAAAVTARTGQHLVDYLRPRLFEPLGIETPPWATSPRGIALGASGMRLSTEDLAKLGQLYLRQGEWEGRRILTEQWVREATSIQVETRNDAPDWDSGYGFQFWRSSTASYRADGAYGQFSFVLPEHDAVIAVTAGLKENWRIPPLVWEHLLPAFSPVPARSAAPPAPSAAGASLTAALSALTMAAPAFAETPPALAPAVSGQRLELPFNTLGITAVTLQLEGDDLRMLVETAESTETLPASRQTWVRATTSLWPYDEQMNDLATASRAGWIDDSTLEIHQQCVETAFRRLWTFRFFEQGEVELTIRLDLPFWADRTEVLRARFA